LTNKTKLAPLMPNMSVLEWYETQSRVNIWFKRIIIIIY